MRSFVVVFVAFCVVGSLPQPVSAERQSANGLVDVCAVLPREEVAKILGRSVGRARPAKRSDADAMECRYNAGAGTITIMVGVNTPKARWDESMKVLKESGATLEPAPGVGDGAFFWDDRLYAHTANYEIAVSTSPTPGSDTAKVRTDAVALAKALIPKLKR
jgi:hypothetical protein